MSKLTTRDWTNFKLRRVNNSDKNECLEEISLQCCRPNPPCHNFCRLDGRLLGGQGIIRNPLTGGEYQVLKVLAHGGMGTTYLVYNYQIRGLAVLKEMSADMATKAKARELFQREGRILQSLQHPGIPKFYDFFWTDEHYSLIMEMVYGQNLEHLAPVHPTQAIGWMAELCRILEYLHGRSSPVIHRDIKPANLILRHRPRRIILIDFGAVKEATTPPGTRIATPGYGAPEQQRGTPCIQSDFYAIGATLVYLLTGQSPTNLYSFSENKFVGLESFGISQALVGAIKTLTAFKPKDRPQTAVEVQTLLKSCYNTLLFL